MTIAHTIRDAYINLQYHGLTLVSCLAQHEKIDALEKVIALGAKIEDVIYGAALANNTELIKKYLGEHPSESYISSAIRGYSRAGNFNAIYKLPGYKNHLDERILGASQGGFSKQIESWLLKDYGLLSAAVKGYVDATDYTPLLNILKGTSLYPQAIYFAARSGCTSLVDILLAECGVKKDTKYPLHSDKTQVQLSARSYLNQAANGYVAGNHYQEAAKMLEAGADISLCVSEIGTYSNLEPFLALYCAINEGETEKSLLETIELRLSIDDKKIPPETLKITLEVKELMSKQGINYIAAKNKLEHNTTNHLLETEEVTLPYLLKILSQEFDFNLDFNVHYDLEHLKSTLTL